MTTPEPSPCPVVMSTTLGRTASATPATEDRSICGAALRVITWVGALLVPSAARTTTPPIVPETRARASAPTAMRTIRPPRPPPVPRWVSTGYAGGGCDGAPGYAGHCPVG